MLWRTLSIRALVMLSCALAPAAAKGNDCAGDSISEFAAKRQNKGVVFGVNYFDSFFRFRDGRRADVRAGLDSLTSSGISVIRVPVFGFWPSEYRSRLSNRQKFRQELLGYLGELEARGIRSILTFSWFQGLYPDLAGEPVTAIANPKSKAWQIAKEDLAMLAEVAGTFKCTLGIEFTNELNLFIDRPVLRARYPQVNLEKGTPRSRTSADRLQHADMMAALRNFSILARQVGWTRSLVTGNSKPRGDAYNARGGGFGRVDTEDEFSQGLMEQSGGSEFDNISVHLYFDEVQEHDFAARSFKTLLNVISTTSLAAQKTLLVGEFGSRDGDLVKQRNEFEMMMQAIGGTRSTILALLWVYDFSYQPELNVTFGNSRSYQLDRLRDFGK